MEVGVPGGVVDGVGDLSVNTDVPGGGHDPQHLRAHLTVLRHRRLVQFSHELGWVVIDVWHSSQNIKY